MKSYFRSRDGKVVIPFSATTKASTEKAYREAQRRGATVLGAPVPHAGPWDRLDLVGHRPRMVIESELTQALIRLPACIGTEHEREANLAVKNAAAELDALVSDVVSRRAKPSASEAA